MPIMALQYALCVMAYCLQDLWPSVSAGSRLHYTNIKDASTKEIIRLSTVVVDDTTIDTCHIMIEPVGCH